MAKRRYYYQSGTKVIERREERTVERIIKKVEPIVDQSGIHKLKITTENGTRIQISQKDCGKRDPTKSSKWDVLKKFLSVGDEVKISSFGGKVMKCQVETISGYFTVDHFENYKDNILLILCNKDERKTVIRICKEDIEDKKIICEDDNYKSLDWIKFCDCLTIANRFYDDIYADFIGHRLVYIRFVE